MQSWKRKTDTILSLSLSRNSPSKTKNIDTGAQQKTQRQLHKHKEKIIRAPHIDGNVSSDSSHLFLLRTYFSHFSFKSKTHVAEKVQRMTDQRKAGESSGPWPRQGPGRPFPGQAAESTPTTVQPQLRRNWVLVLTPPLLFGNLGFSGFICTTRVSIPSDYFTQMLEEKGGDC